MLSIRQQKNSFNKQEEDMELLSPAYGPILKMSLIVIHLILHLDFTKFDTLIVDCLIRHCYPFFSFLVVYVSWFGNLDYFKSYC